MVERTEGSEGATKLGAGGAARKLDSRGGADPVNVYSAGAKAAAEVALGATERALAWNKLAPVAPPEGNISRS